MSTPTFTVNSGIGRFQFRQPTPVASSQADATPRDVDTRQSSQETIKAYNHQLAQLKEQYLKLRTQYQQEQKVCSMKLLNLQRQLRTEQKQYEEIEAEIQELAGQGVAGSVEMGSAAIVEQIWQILQGYRDDAPLKVVKKEPIPIKSEMSRHLSVITEDESEPCFERSSSARRRR